MTLGPLALSHLCGRLTARGSLLTALMVGLLFLVGPIWPNGPPFHAAYSPSLCIPNERLSATTAPCCGLSSQRTNP